MRQPVRKSPRVSGQLRPRPFSSASRPKVFFGWHLSKASHKGNRRTFPLSERECHCRGSGADAISPNEGHQETGMALLQDKIVLVTGAGAGIGRATALAMAAEGAVVAAADINRGAAERTSADCNEERTVGNNRRAIAIEADCGDVASIDRMIAQAVAGLGRLDVIVNNAGVTRFADIMDLTEADWDCIHRVNAKGVFFCLQRVAREMIPRRSGRIVNIASIAGKGYAGTSNAIYAASKRSVISMTRLASLQLAQHNINVNAICPGTTLSALSEANLRVRAAS